MTTGSYDSAAPSTRRTSRSTAAVPISETCCSTVVSGALSKLANSNSSKADDAHVPRDHHTPIAHGEECARRNLDAGGQYRVRSLRRVEKLRQELVAGGLSAQANLDVPVEHRTPGVSECLEAALQPVAVGALVLRAGQYGDALIALVNEKTDGLACASCIIGRDRIAPQTVRVPIHLDDGQAILHQSGQLRRFRLNGNDDEPVHALMYQKLQALRLFFSLGTRCCTERWCSLAAKRSLRLLRSMPRKTGWPRWRGGRPAYVCSSSSFGAVSKGTPTFKAASPHLLDRPCGDTPSSRTGRATL